MANVQGTTSGSGGSASEKDKDSTGVAYDPWVKKEIAGQTGSTRSGSTNNVVTANQSSSKSTDSTGVPYDPWVQYQANNQRGATAPAQDTNYYGGGGQAQVYNNAQYGYTNTGRVEPTVPERPRRDANVVAAAQEQKSVRYQNQNMVSGSGDYAEVSARREVVSNDEATGSQDWLSRLAGASQEIQDRLQWRGNDGKFNPRSEWESAVDALKNAGAYRERRMAEMDSASKELESRDTYSDAAPGTPQSVYNALVGTWARGGNGDYENAGVLPFNQTAAAKYYDEKNANLQEELINRQKQREYRAQNAQAGGEISVGIGENRDNQPDKLNTGDGLSSGVWGSGFYEWSGNESRLRRILGGFELTTLDESGNIVPLASTENRTTGVLGKIQDTTRYGVGNIVQAADMWWKVTKSTPLGGDKSNPTVGEILSAITMTANPKQWIGYPSITTTKAEGPSESPVDNPFWSGGIRNSYNVIWNSPSVDMSEYNNSAFSASQGLQAAIEDQFNLNIKKVIAARTITGPEMYNMLLPLIDDGEGIPASEIGDLSSRAWTSGYTSYLHGDQYDADRARADEVENFAMLLSSSTVPSINSFVEQAFTQQDTIDAKRELADELNEIATNPMSPADDKSKATAATMASQLGYEIYEMQNTSLVDLVDKNEDISRDIMLSLAGDPLGALDAFASVFALTPKARRIGSAVSEAMSASDEMVAGAMKLAGKSDEAVDALRVSIGGAHEFTTAESKFAAEVGLDTSYVKNNSWKLWKNDPDSLAKQDANIIHRGAVYLFRDVDNVSDAKRILQAFIEDPEQLANGLSGFTSKNLVSGYTVDGLKKWRSGYIFTDKMNEARQSLALASGELMSMAEDAPFSLQKWVSYIDDATMKGSLSRRGALAADVPVTATDLRVAKVKSATSKTEQYVVEYLDEAGGVITKTKPSTKAAADDVMKQAARYVKSDMSPVESNLLKSAGHMQKKVFSTMWLDLRPANIVKQSVSGVLHAVTDGTATFARTAELDAWWAKKLGDDLTQPIYRLASDVGSFSQHMGGGIKRGPLRFLNNLWTGDTALFERWGVGEVNNVKRVSQRAGMEAQRKAFTSEVSRAVGGIIDAAGFSPEQAKSFKNTLIDAGVNGGKEDLVRSFMGMLNGEGIPLTLNDFGDDVIGGLSANGWRELKEAIDSSGADDFAAFESAVNDIFIRDSRWSNAIKTEVPPTPGRTIYTDINEVKDANDLVKSITIAAKNAGIPAKDVEEFAKSTVAQGSAAMDRLRNGIIKETEFSPESMRYIQGVFSEIDSAKAQARTLQRDAFEKIPKEHLNGKSAEASASWAKYFSSTQEAWKTYAAWIDEYSTTVASDLSKIASGQSVGGTADAWSRIERLTEMDMADIAKNRSINPGIVAEGSEEAWREVIQANRDYVDVYQSKTFDALNRFYTTDGLDVVMSAENHASVIGDIASGLADINKKNFDEGTVSWILFRNTQNRIWREAADAQAAVWNVATGEIVDKFYSQQLAEALMYDNDILGRVQVVKRVSNEQGAEEFLIRTSKGDLVVGADGAMGVPVEISRNYDAILEAAKRESADVKGEIFSSSKPGGGTTLIRKVLSESFGIPTAYTVIGSGAPRFSDVPAISWARSKGVKIPDGIKSLDELSDDILLRIEQTIRKEAGARGIPVDELAKFRSDNPTKNNPDTLFDWLSMRDDPVQDLAVAAKEREQLLTKTKGAKDFTTGDYANYYSETASRLKKRILDQGKEGMDNLRSSPYQFSPEQRSSALRWFYDEVAPAYDNSVLAATTAAQDMAAFTMIDYSSGKFADAMLAPLVPFHFWATRSGKNWMERAMSNPARMAMYARYKDGLEQDRIRDGVPERYAGTLGVGTYGGKEWRIQSPPESLFVPFVTDFFINDYGDVDQERGAFSKWNQAVNNFGFGIYPWWEAAGLISEGRANEIAPATWLPQADIAATAYGAMSGQIAPGSPHYMPYLGSRTLWGYVASGQMSVSDAMDAQDVAAQIANGYGPLDTQGEGARDNFLLAMKEAQADKLTKLVTRYFTGLGLTPYNSGERMAQEQADLIKNSGWNQIENPYGSVLGQEELKREYPSYYAYQGKNNTLPADDKEWMYLPANQQYIGPVTWAESVNDESTFDSTYMRPGFIRARWLKNSELDASYRSMNNDMDAYIKEQRAKGTKDKDINSGLYDIKDKYYEEQQAIRDRYSFAAYPDDSFGPNTKMNPHESAFQAVMDIVDSVESAHEDKRPKSYSDDEWNKLSKKQKSDIYKAWDEYDKAVYGDVQVALNDMSSIVDSAGGRPLELMEVQTLLDALVDRGTPLDVDAETMKLILDVQSGETREPLQDMAGIYPVAGDLAQAAINTSKYQYDTPTVREFRIEYEKSKSEYKGYGAWRSWGYKKRYYKKGYYKNYRRGGKRYSRKRYYSRSRGRGGYGSGYSSFGGYASSGGYTPNVFVNAPNLQWRGMSSSRRSSPNRGQWQPVSRSAFRPDDTGPDAIARWRKLSV